MRRKMVGRDAAALLSKIESKMAFDRLLLSFFSDGIKTAEP
jgi:hypothetical protein